MPIVLGALSQVTDRSIGPDNSTQAPTPYRSPRYSTSSSQSRSDSSVSSQTGALSAFALRYILRLSSCRLMEGFITPPLPHLVVEELRLSMAPSLHPHYQTSQLLRAAPSSCCLRPLSRVHSYRAYPSPEISPWDKQDFSSFHRVPVTVSPLIPRRCRPSL